MTDGISGRGLSAGGHYYATQDQIGEDYLRLAPDEARHALRVLRLGIGDDIAVVDGLGGWYRARIHEVDREGLLASIHEKRQDVGEPGYQLTIAIGVLKQQSRFEIFLEKAAELGVARIIPVVSERRQTVGVNVKRCHRILVAGMKQSLRSRLPVLADAQPLRSVLGHQADFKMIAHEAAPREENILTHANRIESAGSCHVLIGPEGGFSEVEITTAQAAGWIRVSLGMSRLRTETAGIAAASAIQLIKSRERQL